MKQFSLESSGFDGVVGTPEEILFYERHRFRNKEVDRAYGGYLYYRYQSTRSPIGATRARRILGRQVHTVITLFPFRYPSLCSCDDDLLGRLQDIMRLLGDPLLKEYERVGVYGGPLQEEYEDFMCMVQVVCDRFFDEVRCVEVFEQSTLSLVRSFASGISDREDPARYCMEYMQSTREFVMEDERALEDFLSHSITSVVHAGITNGIGDVILLMYEAAVQAHSAEYARRINPAKVFIDTIPHIRYLESEGTVIHVTLIQ